MVSEQFSLPTTFGTCTLLGRWEMYFSWTWSAWVIYCNYMCIHTHGCTRTSSSIFFGFRCSRNEESWIVSFFFIFLKGDGKVDTVGGGSTFQWCNIQPPGKHEHRELKMMWAKWTIHNFSCSSFAAGFCAALFIKALFFLLHYAVMKTVALRFPGSAREW